MREGVYSPFLSLPDVNPGHPVVSTEEAMEYEPMVVMLSAVLPIYPALFVIYHKIGKYDVICEEFGKLRDEHDRIVKGDDLHEPGHHSDP